MHCSAHPTTKGSSPIKSQSTNRHHLCPGKNTGTSNCEFIYPKGGLSRHACCMPAGRENGNPDLETSYTHSLVVYA